MRFISREDRELVWSKRGTVKQLHQLEEAYITGDYAQAIQKERQILVKAIMKARNDGIDNVKVIGRFLVVYLIRRATQEKKTAREEERINI